MATGKNEFNTPDTELHFKMVTFMLVIFDYNFKKKDNYISTMKLFFKGFKN